MQAKCIQMGVYIEGFIIASRNDVCIFFKCISCTLHYVEQDFNDRFAWVESSNGTDI